MGGSYTLTATLYEEYGLGGPALAALTVSFQAARQKPSAVVDGATQTLMLASPRDTFAAPDGSDFTVRAVTVTALYDTRAVLTLDAPLVDPGSLRRLWRGAAGTCGGHLRGLRRANGLVSDRPRWDGTGDRGQLGEVAKSIRALGGDARFGGDMERCAFAPRHYGTRCRMSQRGRAAPGLLSRIPVVTGR